VGAVAAALLFLVALTVSGARSLGRDRGHPDYSSVAVRAGVGAAIALAVGLVALFVVQRAARHDTALARAVVPDRPVPARTLVARALPWIAAIVALGAVLGSSTAPLYRAGTSARDDSRGESVDPRLPELQARLAQDENGEVYVQVDPDGDGRYDTLVPCDYGASEGPSVYGPDPEPGEPVLVPIDYECDGEIDAYARVESFEIEERFESAPPTTAPGTGRALPSDPPSDTYGNDSADVTQRYDGIYAFDENGDVRLYLDVDGDGTYETSTSPCPLDSGAIIPPSTSIAEGGTSLVPIDDECDGDIDAYARVDDFTPQPSPPPEAGVVPPTVVPPRDRTTEPPSGNGSPDASPSDGTGADATGTDGDSADGADGGDGLPLVLVVLLVALGGALLTGIFVAASRALQRAGDGTPTGDDANDEPADDDADPAGVAATGAIVDSLDAMRAAADPREAIIAAYASLLDGLAANGMPRRASETPEQYLRRCVAELGVPRAPMEELTRLFTVARFSTHPIDEEQRQAAMGCLHEALADVRRRTPTAAGVPS
jgi:hypothetical protein